MNKLFFIFILTSYSFISQAQISLDKNLRTTLNKDSVIDWFPNIKDNSSFRASEIDLNIADSLLTQIINHYNRIVNYGTLTQEEFDNLQKIDSLLSTERLYYKSDGKEKRSLKKLNSEDKGKIELIHSRKDSLNSTQKVLKEKRFHTNDTIIKNHSGSRNRSIVLTNYFRQFTPYINTKGEKLFYVNCICHNNELTDYYWKNQLVVGRDFYECLFNVSINIDTKTCSGFQIN